MTSYWTSDLAWKTWSRHSLKSSNSILHSFSARILPIPCAHSIHSFSKAWHRAGILWGCSALWIVIQWSKSTPSFFCTSKNGMAEVEGEKRNAIKLQSKEKFLRNKNSTSKLFLKKIVGGVAKKLFKLVICLQWRLRTLRRVYKRRKNRRKDSMIRQVQLLIYNE